MNSMQLLGAMELGLIYGLVAIGVYITFRIIDFPDLSVDGSFTLGAATASATIIAGYNCYLATLIAMVMGGVAGAATGYLNVRWGILGLLAGIITMTALYSINIRIMHSPNIAIGELPTIFSNKSILMVLMIFAIGLVFGIYRFFKSNFGLAIRGVGVNQKVSQAYGINVGKMQIIALALSNSIVALAGALFAESQGFADASMGCGTIISGLAAVIVGESLLRPKNILFATIACVIGSILYRIVIALALNAHSIGLQASDLSFITALLVTVVMILSKNNKFKW